ncbi:SpoIIE family protein phosphatase [Caldimonas tepidiphila]|uniref:ATP-binding SpoIIE family protein phosphatase n=1 Tax=Caldimonas tepidiphila TaxID=2315841 RepID=UPI000E5A805D|nr:SpoIIE family protein phosphatase [Caldimonas tepidiphila]
MSRAPRLGAVGSLLAAVLAALAVLAAGAWAARGLRLQAAEELHATARTLAALLAGPHAPDPLPLARAAALRQLTLHDAGGRVLLALRLDDEGRRTAPQPSPPPPLEGSGGEPPAQAPPGGAVLASWVRLPGDAVPGWLHVERDAARLDAAVARIERGAALGALATLLLVLLTLRLGAARTSRALRAAARLAGEPAEDGPPSCLPETRGPREIRALNRTLNALVRQRAGERAALQELRARLRGVLDAAHDAAITLDDEGRVLDFNQAAETMLGYPRAEVLGKPLPGTILPSGHREADEGAVLELEVLRADGTPIPVRIGLAPAGEGGRRYLGVCMRELGEQRRQSEERERLLRSYRRLSRRLERLKLALDEHAIVCITDAQGRITYANRKLAELTGYARHEFLGRTHRILQAGLHEPAVYEELWRTIGRGAVWHGELADRRRDGSLYWVACTVVPMGGVEGEGQHYVSVQTDITAQKQAETALAEARRAELETGSHIQKTLLAGPPRPQARGWWISSHSEPSLGIDGDFYDVLHLDEHCVDLIIADVMGKGVPAALVGAATKMQFSRSIAELTARRDAGAGPPAPARIVAAVHRAMTPDLQSLGSFVTLCYLRLDLRRRQLTYIGCGHEETLVLRRDGGVEALPNQHPPLGILDREEYVESCVPLEPGDAVFLSSDGVVDLVNPAGERWGSERMRATLQRLVSEHPGVTSCLQRMRCEMRDFEAGATQRDDVTMLLLRVPPGDGAPAFARMEFERDAERLPQLRGFVREAAGRCGLEGEELAALELAVVEAATNVIRHAVSPLPAAPIEILVGPGEDHCLVELSYLGEPFDPRGAAEPDFSGRSEGGFGLYIMRHCCERVDYRHHEGVNMLRLYKQGARLRKVKAATRVCT